MFEENTTETAIPLDTRFEFKKNFRQADDPPKKVNVSDWNTLLRNLPSLLMVKGWF